MSLQLPDPPFVIAHRFGNDLTKLRNAAAHGAEVAEADVWWHGGRHEVRHLKTMGPLPLLWDRWRLAPGWRPRLRLEQLLAAWPEGLGLMLDLKRWLRPERLADELRQYPSRGPLLLCSQYWHHLARLEGEEAVLVYSVGNERQLRRLAATLRGRRCDALSVHVRLLDEERGAELRRLAPRLLSWPIDTPQTFERARRAGVHGFITSQPERVRALLAGASSRHTEG